MSGCFRNSEANFSEDPYQGQGTLKYPNVTKEISNVQGDPVAKTNAPSDHSPQAGAP